MKKILMTAAIAATMISCGKKAEPTTQDTDSIHVEAEATAAVLPTSYEKIYQVLAENWVCTEGEQYELSFKMASIMPEKDDAILVRAKHTDKVSYCIMGYDKATDTPLYIAAVADLSNGDEENLKLGYCDNFVVLVKNDAYDFTTEQSCKMTTIYDLRDYQYTTGNPQFEIKELANGEMLYDFSNIEYSLEEDLVKAQNKAKEISSSLSNAVIKWVTEDRNNWTPIQTPKAQQ